MGGDLVQPSRVEPEHVGVLDVDPVGGAVVLAEGPVEEVQVDARLGGEGSLEHAEGEFLAGLFERRRGWRGGGREEGDVVVPSGRQVLEARSHEVGEVADGDEGR